MDYPDRLRQGKAIPQRHPLIRELEIGEAKMIRDDEKPTRVSYEDVKQHTGGWAASLGGLLVFLTWTIIPPLALRGLAREVFHTELTLIACLLTSVIFLLMGEISWKMLSVKVPWYFKTCVLGYTLWYFKRNEDTPILSFITLRSKRPREFAGHPDWYVFPLGGLFRTHGMHGSGIIQTGFYGYYRPMALRIRLRKAQKPDLGGNEKGPNVRLTIKGGDSLVLPLKEAQACIEKALYCNEEDVRTVLSEYVESLHGAIDHSSSIVHHACRLLATTCVLLNDRPRLGKSKGAQGIRLMLQRELLEITSRLPHKHPARALQTSSISDFALPVTWDRSAESPTLGEPTAPR